MLEVSRSLSFTASPKTGAQLAGAIFRMLLPVIMYSSPPKSTPKDSTALDVRLQSF